MTNKSAYIQVKMKPELKMPVNSILKEMGITPTQVITMLYKLIEREKRLPFDVYVAPNKETVKTIEEARAGKGLVVCKDAQDMFDKLEI